MQLERAERQAVFRTHLCLHRCSKLSNATASPKDPLETRGTCSASQTASAPLLLFPRADHRGQATFHTKTEKSCRKRYWLGCQADEKQHPSLICRAQAVCKVRVHRLQAGDRHGRQQQVLRLPHRPSHEPVHTPRIRREAKQARMHADPRASIPHLFQRCIFMLLCDGKTGPHLGTMRRSLPERHWLVQRPIF